MEFDSLPFELEMVIEEAAIIADDSGYGRVQRCIEELEFVNCSHASCCDGKYGDCICGLSLTMQDAWHILWVHASPSIQTRAWKENPPTKEQIEKLHDLVCQF